MAGMIFPSIMQWLQDNDRIYCVFFKYWNMKYYVRSTILNCTVHEFLLVVNVEGFYRNSCLQTIDV